MQKIIKTKLNDKYDVLANKKNLTLIFVRTQNK